MPRAAGVLAAAPAVIGGLSAHALAMIVPAVLIVVIAVCSIITVTFAAPETVGY